MKKEGGGEKGMCVWLVVMHDWVVERRGERGVYMCYVLLADFVEWDG